MKEEFQVKQKKKRNHDALLYRQPGVPLPPWQALT
jgi:hypothetical protein